MGVAEIDLQFLFKPLITQAVGWVERSDTHHLLPLSKNPAIMRDIACPILRIDAELHHAVE
jgi:hypothetical protein